MSDYTEKHTGRFLLFGFDDYYPRGGLDDCKGSFNSKDELLEILNDTLPFDKYNVLDLETYTELDYVYDGFHNITELCEEIFKDISELS